MILEIIQKGKILAIYSIESFFSCEQHPITLEKPPNLVPTKCDRFPQLIHFPLEMRRDPKAQINLLFMAHNPNQNLGIYISSNGTFWYIDIIIEMRFIHEKGNLPVIQSKYELLQTINPQEWSLIMIKNEHFACNFENQARADSNQDTLFMLENCNMT